MSLDPDHIVAVVIASHETSIRVAAEEFQISPTTVQSYRRMVMQSPELRNLFIKAWNTQRAAWATKLGAVRDKVLAHLEQLATNPNTSPKDATAAFKAISEAFVADAIMIDGSAPEEMLVERPRTKSARALVRDAELEKGLKQ